MNLLQDLRYGARMLASKPGVTAAAVLSLALGVGANSAVFSLIDALMLKGLPGVDAPQELVILGEGRSRGISASDRPLVSLFSYPRFLELRDGARSVTSIAGASSMDFTVYLQRGGEETPLQGEARLVSGDYFSTLGAKPALGRMLGPDDDRITGAHAVAVLDYGYWLEAFGGDEAVVGSAVELNDRSFTIVGVASHRFGGERIGERPDLYIPARMQPVALREDSFLEDPNISFLQLMGRLAPGATIEQAQGELAMRWRRLLEAEGGATPSEAWTRGIEEAALVVRSGANGYSSRSDLADALWLLFGVTALVLLIACANVANLMLARGASRRRELGVRVALGANRNRLFVQMLTESLMLAGIAAATSLALAAWSRDVLLAMAGVSAADLGLEAVVDWRIAGFTGAIALGTGILFGLTPAMRAGRTDVMASMRGARGAAGASSGRLHASLVVGQAALSLLLLFGAGLFVESLGKLAKADVGMARESLVSIEIDAQGGGFDRKTQPEMGRRLVEAVEAVPGVESAAMTYRPIATPGNHTRSVQIEGHEEGRDEDVSVRVFLVSPGYFETVGTPILAGRAFGPEDAEFSKLAAIVDQNFADRFLQDGNPIGRRLEYDGDIGMIPVVGVAAAARLNGARESPLPTIYVSGYAYPDFWRAMAVRATGDPAVIVAAVRAAITEAEPRLPINSIATVEQRLAQQTTADRMMLRLTAAFGGLALLLAAVGLYGVLSYRVAGRTSEMGVRMAVGADRRDVLGLVLKEGLLLAGLGVALGATAAPFAATAVKAALYQTEPWNAAALAAAAGGLLAVAALAALLPSLRAARLDPVTALREE